MHKRKKIDNHVKDLTENLHNTNSLYRQEVQAIGETVTYTETRIAEITESGFITESIDGQSKLKCIKY